MFFIFVTIIIIITIRNTYYLHTLGNLLLATSVVTYFDLVSNMLLRIEHVAWLLAIHKLPCTLCVIAVANNNSHPHGHE